MGLQRTDNLKSLPLASCESVFLSVCGEDWSERILAGDLCSSPEEFVPSDWVSESVIAVVHWLYDEQ